AARLDALAWRGNHLALHSGGRVQLRSLSIRSTWRIVFQAVRFPLGIRSRRERDTNVGRQYTLV
ncbi:MAG: hypothetical protein ACPIOQ_50245, partial [Promethearchaeia archaeon]